MVGIKKAAEVHKRYSLLDFPVNVEEIARKEGLTLTIWPLIPPVEEVKIGNYIGLSERLSNEWRRWDIAHALGHHFLMHHGNQLVFRRQSDISKNEKQTNLHLICLCLNGNFRN